MKICEILLKELKMIMYMLDAVISYWVVPDTKFYCSDACQIEGHPLLVLGFNDRPFSGSFLE